MMNEVDGLRLVVQVPCLNEEETLPLVLESIPKEIPGIDEIIILIIDRAAGTSLPDAASGSRAYSRESIMLLNTITRFSYCMETIIQAGNKKLKIASIPIRTNPKTRESRLFSSTYQHVFKSAAAIV